MLKREGTKGGDREESPLVCRELERRRRKKKGPPRGRKGLKRLILNDSAQGVEGKERDITAKAWN